PLFFRALSTPTLFPYTTLFRSRSHQQSRARLRIRRTRRHGPDWRRSWTADDGGSRRALPSLRSGIHEVGFPRNRRFGRTTVGQRSEEHTSELQSPDHLVCRLLL